MISSQPRASTKCKRGSSANAQPKSRSIQRSPSPILPRTPHLSPNRHRLLPPPHLQPPLLPIPPGRRTRRLDQLSPSRVRSPRERVSAPPLRQPRRHGPQYGERRSDIELSREPSGRGSVRRDGRVGVVDLPAVERARGGFSSRGVPSMRDRSGVRDPRAVLRERGFLDRKSVV